MIYAQPKLFEPSNSGAYNDFATRMALLAPFVAKIEADELTPADISEIMMRADRSRRQTIRMIEEMRDFLVNGPREAVVPLPRDFLIELAKSQGNVAAAIKAYYGKKLPVHASTIYRWLERVEIGLKLALRQGPAALDKFMSIGVVSYDIRNGVHMADEVHIPFLCRNSRGEIVDDLWALMIYECFSRLILALIVTLGPSNQFIGGAAYARAVLGWEHEGVVVGGAGDVLVVDRAEMFKAPTLRHVTRIAGTKLEFARAQMPTDKAPIERMNGTLIESGLKPIAIGYIDGPKRLVSVENINGHRTETERSYFVPSRSDQLLRAEAIAEGLEAAVAEHNFNHVVSTTGMVAIDRYNSQRNLQNIPGPAAFWRYALEVPKVHQVERRGVFFDNRRWKAAGLNAVAKEVTVRVLPGTPDPIVMAGRQVDRRVRFLAVLNDKETNDEKNARLASNIARKETVRDLAMEANVQLQAESNGQPVPSTNIPTRPARAKAKKAAKAKESSALTRIGNLDAWRNLDTTDGDAA